VILEATHEAALRIVPEALLRRYAAG
jgi:hypothetical protein